MAPKHMRTKNEVEQFYNEIDNESSYDYRIYKQNEAILEVLLDIRDLLSKPIEELQDEFYKQNKTL